MWIPQITHRLCVGWIKAWVRHGRIFNPSVSGAQRLGKAIIKGIPESGTPMTNTVASAGDSQLSLLLSGADSHKLSLCMMLSGRAGAQPSQKIHSFRWGVDSIGRKSNLLRIQTNPPVSTSRIHPMMFQHRFPEGKDITDGLFPRQ